MGSSRTLAGCTPGARGSTISPILTRSLISNATANEISMRGDFIVLLIFLFYFIIIIVSCFLFCLFIYLILFYLYFHSLIILSVSLSLPLQVAHLPRICFAPLRLPH
jgi:hypothetical protein